jgi:hypothetical protein
VLRSYCHQQVKIFQFLSMHGHCEHVWLISMNAPASHAVLRSYCHQQVGGTTRIKVLDQLVSLAVGV